MTVRLILQASLESLPAEGVVLCGPNMVLVFEHIRSMYVEEVDHFQPEHGNIEMIFGSADNRPSTAARGRFNFEIPVPMFKF